MINPSVLVVDDEADARELLGVGLARRGFSVTSARNGGEAMQVVRPDTQVVLTDLMMPDHDGLWLLETLAGQRHRGLRVVLTSHADRDRAIHALNSGADYLVEKPFTAAAVADLLERLLAQREETHGAGSMFRSRLSGLDLNERDRQLVALILRGLDNRDIASVLHTTDQGVHQSVLALYGRLGVTGRGDLFHLIFPI